MKIREACGQSGAALNMPSTRRQKSIIVTPGIPSERGEIKIGVTLHPMPRYLHCCAFTLRLRDDYEPTWVATHVGVLICSNCCCR
jgi:hypothetical protein